MWLPDGVWESYHKNIVLPELRRVLASKAHRRGLREVFKIWHNHWVLDFIAFAYNERGTIQGDDALRVETYHGAWIGTRDEDRCVVSWQQLVTVVHDHMGEMLYTGLIYLNEKGRLISPYKIDGNLFPVHV